MKKMTFLLLFLCLQTVAWANYTWHSRQVISGKGAVCPRFALDKAGNAVSVWMVQNVSGCIAQAADKPFGRPWEEPITLSKSDGVSNMESSSPPKMVIDSEGNATAVWCIFDPINSRWGLQSSTKLFGLEWSSPYCLSLDKGSQGIHFSDIEPQLAIDSHGNAIATWRRNLGDTLNNVYFSNKPFGQNWSGAAPLYEKGSHIFLSLVMSPEGDAIAAWSKLGDGSKYLIQSATKALDQSWSTPYDVSVYNRDSWFFSIQLPGIETKLAVNSFGNAAIVWEGLDSCIYASEKDFGKEWTVPTPFGVTKNVFNAPIHPEVVIDDLRNIIAIWIEYVHSGVVIPSPDICEMRSAIKTKDGKWSSPISMPDTQVSVDNFKNGYSSPQITIDDRGNAIAGWIKCMDDSSCIQVAVKPLEGEWTSPLDVCVAEGLASNLNIGIDSSQNLLLVWEEGLEHVRYVSCISGEKR